MRTNSVEKEQEKTNKFLIDNNISEERAKELYDEIYSQMDDSLTDKQKELRTQRRIRGALRRAANSNSDLTEGIIVARFRNSTYNLFAWNKVDEYVKENGLEAAKIAGMADDNGNYLYTSGFNKGEKIDPKNITGSAVAIIKGEDGEPEGRYVSIGRYQINETIPLGQEISIKYKEGNKNGQIFSDNKLIYYNGCDGNNLALFTEEEIMGYENIINDLFTNGEGEIIFETYDEFLEYMDENCSDKYNVGGLWGDIIDIGVRDDPNARIPITVETDLDSITFWAEPDIFKGLNIQVGISGILFASAYKGKEDTIGFNVAGFIPLSDDDI